MVKDDIYEELTEVLFHDAGRTSISIFWFYSPASGFAIAEKMMPSESKDIKDFMNSASKEVQDGIVIYPRLHEEYWEVLGKKGVLKKLNLEGKNFNSIPGGRVSYNPATGLYVISYGYWINKDSLDKIFRRFNVGDENVDLWCMMRFLKYAILGHYKFDGRDEFIQSSREFLMRWCVSHTDTIFKIENTLVKKESLRINTKGKLKEFLLKW